MKIKLSNKLLLIAGSVPILFIVVMLFVFKFFLWDGGNSQANSIDTSNLITKTLPLEDFTEITINGISSVNISRGDTYLVKITAPKDEMDKIKGEKNGTSLSLDYTPNAKNSIGPKQITGEIMLPEASTIHIQRAAKIDLSGLKINSLFITAQGPVKVTGNDAMIHDLKLNNAGATSIALSSVPVTNADLFCQGVYSIEIMMNGGRLSGDIGGLGSVNFQGTVSVNELRVNGSQNNIPYRAK
jgi:hypothetical protein